jgi:hypothetical protein
MDESEIISFIFTEKWLIENDKSQNSDFIKITIPKTEIYNKQYDSNGVSNLIAIGKIEDNEKVVLLQVPKNIPELDNLISSKTITLDYPTYCYSYFSDISKLFNEINKRKSTRDQGQKEQIKNVKNQKQIFQSKSSNLYAEWACYNTNWFQYPKALRGDMNPENLLNDGQTLSLYHEREIYLNRNGDTIELVLWYSDNGNIYLSAPLYDENQLKWGNGGVPSGIWIDASSMSRYYYEIYIRSNGQYNVNFLNTGTGIWYDYTYNDADNPSGHISGITGSSELTLYGSVTDSFSITTNNMRDYGIKDSLNGNWIAPDSRFSWDQYKYENNGQYVFMNSWQSGGNIYTYHRASDTDT